MGELLVHISHGHTIPYQIHAEEHRSSLEGFNFPSMFERVMAEEKVPRNKEPTIALLHSSGEKCRMGRGADGELPG